VRIKKLVKKFGMYRGQGRITMDDSGITVEGRHVRSIGARWGIGILIVIASGILTGGAVILGIIPVYLLVEYVILTRENISISWDELTHYCVDPKRKLVGLEFQGPDWTSPAILRTEQFKDLVNKLRAKAPEKDVTQDVAIG
jgi:hypothetical protein